MNPLPPWMQRTLQPDMLVIAGLNALSVVAGVMGSVDAEVDNSTTDLILESAFLAPVLYAQPHADWGCTVTVLNGFPEMWIRQALNMLHAGQLI